MLYRKLRSNGVCAHHHRSIEAAAKCGGAYSLEFVQQSTDKFKTWCWVAN